MSDKNDDGGGGLGRRVQRRTRGGERLSETPMANKNTYDPAQILEELTALREEMYERLHLQSSTELVDFFDAEKVVIERLLHATADRPEVMAMAMELIPLDQGSQIKEVMDVLSDMGEDKVRMELAKRLASHKASPGHPLERMVKRLQREAKIAQGRVN